MPTFLMNVLRSFGVNRAICYGIFTRMWGGLAGLLTILLVATRFSKIEQGYYYTFSSLLALQVFFELGLITVLAQFAAHEFAFLSWGKMGEIKGDETHRDRFVDLLGKGFKWYTVSAALLILVLLPAGLLFFTQSSENSIDFPWRLPWALAVTGVGCNLMLLPFYAVITGSGDVASINRREMMGWMTGSIFSWLVILGGGGLYAVPAFTSGTIIIGVAYLFKSKPRLVKTAFFSAYGPWQSSHTVSWWGEVWPMQWKIALSWVSGYFIFQCFTPVLFKFHGPVVAGQMGMTLTIWNVIMATCSTWMAVNAPEFGKLIATKSWRELDAEFFRLLKQSVVVTILICSVTLTAIYALQQYTPLGDRLIPVQYILFMFAALLVQVVTNGFATYLRAHKREPFLYLSMVAALLQALCVIVIGELYSYQGITIVFAVIITLVFFPAAYLIWKKCRREWHNS